MNKHVNNSKTVSGVNMKAGERGGVELGMVSVKGGLEEGRKGSRSTGDGVSNQLLSDGIVLLPTG